MRLGKKVICFLMLSILIVIGNSGAVEAVTEEFDGVHLYILVNSDVFELLAPDDFRALENFAYRILDANEKNKVSVIEGNAPIEPSSDKQFELFSDDHRLEDHIKLPLNVNAAQRWDLSDSFKIYGDLLKRRDPRLKNVLLLIDIDGGLSSCYEKYSNEEDPYRRLDEGMTKGFTKIMQVYNGIPGSRDVYTISGRIGAPPDDFTNYLNIQEGMVSRMLHESIQNCGTGFSGFAGQGLPPLNEFAEDILKMKEYKQPGQSVENQSGNNAGNRLVNDNPSVSGSERKDDSKKPGSSDIENFKNPFKDVSTADWYYNAVQHVFEHNLMKGTDSLTFSPNEFVTRAQMAQIMFNMSEATEKTSAYEATYKDVAADSWAANAIGWAQKKGIVVGYEDGRFGPNDDITREQAVVIFQRYLRATGRPVNRYELNEFVDSGDVSEYAVEAMVWATNDGIIKGDSDRRLNPKASMRRCEMAQILMNLGGQR